MRRTAERKSDFVGFKSPIRCEDKPYRSPQLRLLDSFTPRGWIDAADLGDLACLARLALKAQTPRR